MVNFSDKEADKIIDKGEKLYKKAWNTIRDSKESLCEGGVSLESIYDEKDVEDYRKLMSALFNIASGYELLVYGEKIDDNYLLKLSCVIERDNKSVDELNKKVAKLVKEMKASAPKLEVEEEIVEG